MFYQKFNVKEMFINCLLSCFFLCVCVCVCVWGGVCVCVCVGDGVGVGGWGVGVCVCVCAGDGVWGVVCVCLVFLIVLLVLIDKFSLLYLFCGKDLKVPFLKTWSKSNKNDRIAFICQ